MPDLPEYVTIEEIESFLDRTAIEITEASADCLVPIFQWLEEQLEAKKRRQSTMDLIYARAAKSSQRGVHDR
ncbi:hypothetical protein G6K88_07870 [Agrobacterium rhizogenes]|uniref:hypothetical protein n=1 Tax=Rhizobium rhizogenes TaxID=359 RepID=UPI0015748FEF|nr:hypothetical protein [Rhizobium rhizogenes]NTI01935.1 hypothetical protein [Rhizobium rhizogenes]NTI08738.1 hypothetical protein [Rhizobium rhizogenes]